MFGMERDHKHKYKLCMEYYLQVNSYKCGSDAKL
jgi:hypothetical protein